MRTPKTCAWCGDQFLKSHISASQWETAKFCGRKCCNAALGYARSGRPPYLVEDRGHATPCWIWQRSRRGNNYGSMARDGRTRSAHIVYWEDANGPVPSGLQLDHLCRNRLCVNPDHLEPVTPRENTLRSNAPAAFNARKTECIHGHPFDEENTEFVAASDGRMNRRCKACNRNDAREYQRRKSAERRQEAA